MGSALRVSLQLFKFDPVEFVGLVKRQSLKKALTARDGGNAIKLIG
jgi:hypothetical protein